MQSLIHHTNQTHTIRPLSIDVIKSFTPGDEALVFTAYHSNGPRVLRVKINGKPRTWKTRPDDVTVPIKYGLYEYAQIEYTDGAMTDPNVYFITTDEEGQS